MSSDDSDDEPLSVLAAAKKLNPDQFDIIPVSSIEITPIRKKKKKKWNVQSNKPSLTIKLRDDTTETAPKVIERPTDVWLYMKDLNTTGPYSCLLCPDWFINRTKLMVHYILNHKKDFCGICRYFVPDRDTWYNHNKFHTPWSCSQCGRNFPLESEMREHLSRIHNLVHCRLCHFRTTDDEQYNLHLYQKHNIANITSKNANPLWKLEYEGSLKFACALCAKPNILSTNFFNHYMGYHHFTIKCFSSVISGYDVPFTVEGADVSSQFINTDNKTQIKCGYVDLEKRVDDHQDVDGENNIANILEIKQEATSDNEDQVDEEGEKNNIVDTYKGDMDFDVTLMELIVLQTCYHDYINEILTPKDSNIILNDSQIDYKDVRKDFVADLFCSLCKTKFNTMEMFTTHMGKMHCVKSVHIYSCRVCTNAFETHQELINHEKREMGEFDDLWICQFCDKEFENREATRRHLNEHQDLIEFDNCFSPHLGFKCKFCPTLFWNETDRKTHQIRVHFDDNQEDFYKCHSCNDEIFSDKVWFTHHFIEKHHADLNNAHYLLKCCLCCLILSSVEDMRKHFNTEHPEATKVFCSLGACMYKPLSLQKSFKIHLKLLHSIDAAKPERATCVICGRDFSSARACSTHMAQVHGPGKFKCKLCREVMHSMDERKLHYLIRHPGRHPFECKECGKSFQYKSSLYLHKQDHSPNKQTYTCSYCKKVFSKKDSYREHIQIHEGPRHACSYCPKRFVQRSNMLRHERRHTGERPYACPHCGRTFADKGACTAHARTHTKDHSYPCLYCGQTFVQKSKLTYHIRKHTGENLETCTVCSKLFTSACSLREHMKTHDKKVEPTNCPLCNRQYQDQKCMLRHLRTAHTRARFSCPVCRKSMTTPSGLRYHIVTHSKVNMFRCKICPKSYSIKRTVVKHLRRRHGLKGAGSTDFFETLDPRKCGFGLDEKTMTEIFGPPKSDDVLIGDFVTLQSLQMNNQNNEANTSDDDDDDKDKSEEESESEGRRQEEITNITMELEPTDFVSVKVEPIDYEENAE